MLGLAIGDALGAPVEFKSRGSYPRIEDYQEGGPWDLPAGYWTDDTSMSICLAESIIHTGTLDPQDLLERFGRWYQSGENSSTGVCFDIGNTTQINITRFLRAGVYTPSHNTPTHNGNGSIMRLAPVAIRWWAQPDMVGIFGRRQSLTTHGSDECLDACDQLGHLMVRAIRGANVHGALTEWAATIPEASVPNSGRARDTLLAAKWSVGSSTTFEEALVRSVNLGGDTDSIGAVAGQIAGAIWGVSAIPPRWLDGLHDLQRLTSLAERLFDQGAAPSI